MTPFFRTRGKNSFVGKGHKKTCHVPGSRVDQVGFPFFSFLSFGIFLFKFHLNQWHWWVENGNTAGQFAPESVCQPKSRSLHWLPKSKVFWVHPSWLAQSRASFLIFIFPIEVTISHSSILGDLFVPLNRRTRIITHTWDSLWALLTVVEGEWKMRWTFDADEDSPWMANQSLRWEAPRRS